MNTSSKGRPDKAPKEKAEILLRAALSKKALNPTLIRLTGLTTVADYFLIVSATSGRQVRAVAEAVLRDARKHRLARFSAEGVQEGNWALLDYGDVVVHVFRKPVREFYDLEGLWVEAPREVFSDDILKEIDAAAEGTDEEEADSLEL